MRSFLHRAQLHAKPHPIAIMLLVFFAFLSIPIASPYAQPVADRVPPAPAAPPGAGAPDDVNTVDSDDLSDEQCLQAWPVSCEEGGSHEYGCGDWIVQEKLAEPDNLLGAAHCGTGSYLRLPDPQRTQGQPVGTMFAGTVAFAQAGIARDGNDYGGVVVIKLDLKDGSPQCYLRYMFLDRRDLPVVGTEVEAGQRIGSIASNDMNEANNWWTNHSLTTTPQLKVDIGCDEALVNLPHFMPLQPYPENGDPDNPDTCSLTKMRFPTRPFEYLVNTDWGANRACQVGIREDARFETRKSVFQDESQTNTPLDLNRVAGVKPQDQIKRKTTPVMSFFGPESDEAKSKLEQTLFGANHRRSANNPLFRSHTNYQNATNLRCREMEEIFQGRRTDDGTLRSLTPDEVRELLAFCTNQHILGRARYPNVYELTTTNSLTDGNAVIRDNPSASPIPALHLETLSAEDRAEYEQLVADGATRQEIIDAMPDAVRNISWLNQCQPLAMQDLSEDFEPYQVNQVLEKSWLEQLIMWPKQEGRELDSIMLDEPVSVESINDYADYPYERINDPANPFSPRHIFRETERERYSNYGVQCAATPVDLILGEYDIPQYASDGRPVIGYDDNDNPILGDIGDEPVSKTINLGKRSSSFHQCISCRIKVNDKVTKVPDPYSYQNAGGCDNASNGTYISGELCPGFVDLAGDPIPDFLEYLYELEDQYGLARGMLHATATVESGCRACPSPADNCSSGNPWNAKGMFQMVYPTEWGLANNSEAYDPWKAAEAAAKYHAAYAQREQCDLPGTICAYNCGPGCGNCGNSQTSNYIAKFQGWGISTACSNSGPFPQGNGTGGGSSSPGGGDSDDDDSSSGLGDITDVLQIGSGGPATGMGNFDPRGCPNDYVTTTEHGMGPPMDGIVRMFSDFPDSMIPADEETDEDADSEDPAPVSEPIDYANKACSPFSNPTPEVPVPGAGVGESWRDWCHTDSADQSAGNGCVDRNHWAVSGAWGCWRTEQGSAGSSTWPKCDLMSPQYNGNIFCAGGTCSSARMHEGVDVAFALGAPIYSAGNGRVTKSTWMVTVDHSGYCIHDPIGTPGCLTYPDGMKTNYLHMGSERIFDDITVGAEIQRCQQIGTVGTVLSNGGSTVPHLHFETKYPANNTTSPVFGGAYSNSQPYWPYDPRETYHAHPTDQSCTGGIWDEDGSLGSAAGICRYALPMNKYRWVGDPPRRVLKTDLDPPEYLTEELDLPEVPMPSPRSEGLEDPMRDAYDLEERGMIKNGIWVPCENFNNEDEEAACRDWGTTHGEEPAEEDGEDPAEEEEEDTGLVASDGYINPTPCARVSSPYGYRIHPISGVSKLHSGTDLAEPQGVAILAAANGTVVSAGWAGGYGNQILIQHPDGKVTSYNHQYQMCAQPGDDVVQGQVIGYVGTTGYSTGPHLHLEMLVGGAKIDPLSQQGGIPAPDAAGLDCGAIRAARCDSPPFTGLPSGAGVAGSVVKTIDVPQACSVRYDRADTVAQCAFPEDERGCGALGHFNQRGGADGTGDCCFNITKPVPALNVLKLRTGFVNEVPAPFYSANTLPRPYTSEQVTSDHSTNGRFATFPRETDTREVSHPIDDYEKQHNLKGFLAQHNTNSMPPAWQGFRLRDEGGVTDYSATQQGAPEGYTFYEHFRNHRPYMRWWDTGAETHNLYMDQVNAESVSGAWDAIVGVGSGVHYFGGGQKVQNSCGYGGWGEINPNADYRRCTWSENCRPGCSAMNGDLCDEDATLLQPDKLHGNTSWLELKLYQARATYRHSLHCIPRYETQVKPNSAEEYVLNLAGGSFNTTVGQSSGVASIGWPLSWRGYVSEPIAGWRFPYLEDYPNPPAGMQTTYGAFVYSDDNTRVGLDVALPGDVLIWDQDVLRDEETGALIRIPHAAFVSSADNAAIRDQIQETGNNPLRSQRFFSGEGVSAEIHSLTVTEYDYGRYPDVCGGTNWQGMGPERKLYKGELPIQSRETLDDVFNVAPNLQDCGNPDLASCHENLWDRVKVYRPWRDVRD